LNQILPFLDIILSQDGEVKSLVNQWLKIVSAQQITEPCFIESMFHIFSNSMSLSAKNVKLNAMVDLETINHLAEIRYQLLDERNEKSK